MLTSRPPPWPKRNNVFYSGRLHSNGEPAIPRRGLGLQGVRERHRGDQEILSIRVPRHVEDPGLFPVSFQSYPRPVCRGAIVTGVLMSTSKNIKRKRA